jgi:hypothetical protein
VQEANELVGGADGNGALGHAQVAFHRAGF